MTIYEWMDAECRDATAHDWDQAYESKTPSQAIDEMARRRMGRIPLRDPYGDRGRAASPVPQ